MARLPLLKNVFATLAIVSAALFSGAGCSRHGKGGWRTPDIPPHPSLQPIRESAGDLEITGLPGNQTQYLTPHDLATIPKASATIANDPDFPGQTLHVTGVYLDVLARAIGVPSSFDLTDALCSDDYRAHFPAGYIAQHHPILVVDIDGMPTAIWAARAHQDDPGPYFIAYDNFTPNFKVLAHADQPQLPTNIVRLDFSTSALYFGPITPPGTDPAAMYVTGTPVQQGFSIAKQNCLRCHFKGLTGGTKSDRPWSILSAIARTRPAYFASYIVNPKAVDPNAQMPPNPTYDKPTIDALTAYFRTFTAPAFVPSRPVLPAPEPPVTPPSPAAAPSAEAPQ